VPAPPLLVSCLTHLYVAGRTDEGGLAKDFGCNRDNAIPISTVNSRFVRVIKFRTITKPLGNTLIGT